MQQHIFTFTTTGRGFIDITAELEGWVMQHNIHTGVCHIFLQHTSASLIICENADPAVRTDLENYFARLVKDGDPLFTHTAEGEDDMSAHVRNILTSCSLTVPIASGQLALGIWQGVFLWEHRYAGTKRRVVASLIS